MFTLPLRSVGQTRGASGGSPSLEGEHGAHLPVHIIVRLKNEQQCSRDRRITKEAKAAFILQT